jgi:hypothetical protein
MTGAVKGCPFVSAEVREQSFPRSQLRQNFTGESYYFLHRETHGPGQPEVEPTMAGNQKPPPHVLIQSFFECPLESDGSGITIQSFCNEGRLFSVC